MYQAVKALLRVLNPAAVIVEAINGAVPPEAVLGTKLFSIAQVMTCLLYMHVKHRLQRT